MENNNPENLPILENWKYLDVANVLYGDIYNDKRFSDGTYGRTSKVVELNREEGYAQTMNTKYKLGVEAE